LASRTRNLIVLGLLVALLGAAFASITLQKTRLGLDLAGGVELIYRAIPNDPTKDPTADEIGKAIETIRKRVNELGTTEAEIQSLGSNLILVALPDVDDPERAKKLVGSTARLLFFKWEDNVVVGPGKTDGRLDANGASNSGYDTLYEAVKLAAKQKPSKEGADRDNDSRAGDAYYLFTEGKEPKLVAGPALSKAELLGGEFGGEQPEDTQILKVPRGTLVVCQGDRCGKADGTKTTNASYFVLRDNVELTGDEVKRASATTDQQTGQPAVALEFNGKGSKIFERVTRDLYNDGQSEPVLPAQKRDAAHRFAIVLDGETISTPYIDPSDATLAGGIAGGNAQITGLTTTEARDLAKQIDLGALPVSLKLESQRRVSASLGKQDLNKALMAAAAGFGLVLIFLLAFYRILGVIAGIALGIYAVLFFAVSKAIGFTFTLPGIAGLVLTLSVAADANIVIFERIKEEVRAGRSIPSAISTGYSKGFATIVDANVVTLITAFILFVLATAGVRGFAASLGLGTIISLFTAVLVTSAILGLLAGWRGLERPSALGVREKTQRWHFDFMGRAKLFFSMSGVILLIGALAVAGMGLNLGIDFESGTRITAGFDKALSETQVREVFSEVGASNAKIQRVEGDKALGKNAFQISAESLDEAEVDKVRELLDESFSIKGKGGDAQFAVESVGPTFGAAVARSAVIAIIFSLLVIGVYVALRFSPKFAVPVLIALAHDLLITMGVYALVDREMTSATVAALLTVLGFSLYDTIIVFDRIRENLPRMPRAAFSQIVNRSMSEVLTRSLATSFVTALPILALLLFGGDTLKDFAFALLIGTISGAYSSIFIASPVLTLWKEREPIFRQRRERIEQDNNGIVPPFYADTIGGVEVEDPRMGAAPKAEVAPRQEPAQEQEEPTTVEPEPVAANGDSAETAVTGGGNIARATSKDQRRAARQRRKHGRTR
jgi:SecD/SecF fusion protein